MSAKVPVEAVRELAARLDGMPCGARASVKREFAELHGISLPTLSRCLCEVGFRSHARADAGVRRKSVDETVLLKIAGFQRTSVSAIKGVTMPIADAINIAEDSGEVEPGTLSPSYVNAWLREHNASRRAQRQPTPHTELRTNGPNHVHQVDFSLAVNWKVFQGKAQYEDLIYKNKLPAAGEPRLYRLLLVDHCSGCIAPHYTCSTGETVQALLEGLYCAWSEKRCYGESVKAQFPFRGVPRILMADQGSANKSGITDSLLKRLGVKLMLHAPRNSRATGAVERAHGIWESKFESRFRLAPPVSIEDLNDRAIDFAARLNAEVIHDRHGSPRSAMWQWHINRNEDTLLRELTVDFEIFKSICVSTPIQCRVGGNRIIRFRSQKYRVPEEVLPGEYVTVQYSPFKFPQVSVVAASGVECFCEPVQLDEFGYVADAPTIGLDYRAQKKTPSARFVDQADDEAKAAIGAKELRVFGHHRHAVRLQKVPHSGVDVIVPEPEVVFVSKVKARMEVVSYIGRPLAPAEVAYMNRAFGERVTAREIDAVIREIETGIGAAVVAITG